MMTEFTTGWTIGEIWMEIHYIVVKLIAAYICMFFSSRMILYNQSKWLNTIIYGMQIRRSEIKTKKDQPLINEVRASSHKFKTSILPAITLVQEDKHVYWP